MNEPEFKAAGQKWGEPVPNGQIPSAQHYRAIYLGGRFQRLASYRQQLLYATRDDSRSYLVIGKGDGFTVSVRRTPSGGGLALRQAG